MDAQDNAPSQSAGRARRRPAPTHPLATDSAPQDLTFKAVVREAKGFKSFEENISFTGLTSWRLSQILRKVIRGLRIDPKYKYKVAIWSGEKKSEPYTEWEKLDNIAQLYGEEVPRLRIYRHIRPCNRKKPMAVSASPSDSLAPYAHPAPDPPTVPFDFQAMLLLSQMLIAQQYYMMSCMFSSSMPR